MTKVDRYKRGLSKFITSEKGQRFFNFAYSIGAAIVIWGALFKILHLPGGNALLCLGMGTEVLMFVLTAFDRPPKEYKWENVFPALEQEEESETKELVMNGTIDAQGQAAYQGGATVVGGGGGAVIIGGGAGNGTTIETATIEPQPRFETPTDMGSATQLYIDQIASVAEQLQKLEETTATLNKVSETLLQSYGAITAHADDINDSSNGYATQMQNLTQNIRGLNTIYEIQLKSVSSQIDAIDRVNRGIKDIRDMFEKSAEQSTRYAEETEKMARYMQQLNQVYEKMIHAMTINMAVAMPGAASQMTSDK